MADSVNISGQSNIIQFKVPECKLSEDLGNLFDNEKFSDVTLAVGGREFQAHKAILAGKFEMMHFLLVLVLTSLFPYKKQREVLFLLPCSNMRWRRGNKIVLQSRT